MTRLFLSVLAALLLAGCASGPVAPTRELRSLLAPTGKLRVGVYPGSPSSFIKDKETGENRGLTYDLGKELARRLGVPFEPVVFARVAEVLEGIKAGKVDMTITNATEVRARDMDFTAPILDVELGYLVPAGSRVASRDDLDKAGVRVGVSQGGTSQSVLSRELKFATVVPAPSVDSAIDMIGNRRIDVFATNKAVLYQMSDLIPGSRLLPGRWGVEHFAFAIPKGRAAALPYMKAYAEDITEKRYLALTVERAGLRGAIAAQ
ncbi:MAG: ABC transporter substrate-binding protein [Betaproteobacteria bacterium]|nr:ABC transporter substrate-binding protein [Betaproteobacteria bacterium]